MASEERSQSNEQAVGSALGCGFNRSPQHIRMILFQRVGARSEPALFYFLSANIFRHQHHLRVRRSEEGHFCRCTVNENELPRRALEIK